MQRVSTILILCLLVGLINMATMPISIGHTNDLNQDPTHNVDSSSEIHHHCEESKQKNQGDQKSNKQANFVNHYCCSIFAVLPTSLIIRATDERTFYLVKASEKPTSYVAHSIYKPPKNDIS